MGITFMTRKRLTMRETRQEEGFSFIELALVFLIVGLIAAGVFAVMNLIRVSEMQAMIAETDDLKRNISAFEAKYHGLPGDLINASDYFGTSDCGATSASQMNGNGDAKIRFAQGGDGVIESYKAWCHLTLAELTKHRYDGSISDYATIAVPGEDIPATKRNGGGYFIGFGLQENRVNQLVLGKPSGGMYAANVIVPNGILAVDEARYIDLKTDDGDPMGGQVRAFDGDDVAAESCVTAAGVYQYVSSSVLPSAYAAPAPPLRPCGLVFFLVR
jgi:hypothetical protein